MLELRLLYRPRMPRLVTLLPEPDSPTIASDLPRSTVKDNPSTARTSPSSVGKWMRRLRTSRNADGASCDTGTPSERAGPGLAGPGLAGRLTSSAPGDRRTRRECR